MNNENINLQQEASHIAKLMNYRMHAQVLDIPIFVGFQELENNDPQTILLAKKDGITEQLVSDGFIEKNEFENRIELVIKNTKEWMKNNGFYSVENSFMYHKDYNNGVFNFKIYFQNMIGMSKGDKYVIRNIIAYFYEPRFSDFYQFQIGAYFDYPLEQFKIGVIDLDNDEVAKTLDTMMNNLLDNLKYKEPVDRKVKRNDIAKQIFECKENNSQNDYYVEELLGIIEKIISVSNFESDEDFVFGGRKKFLYEEFNNYLDNTSSKSDESLFLAINNLEEFICNNNYGSFIELANNSNMVDGKIIEKLRERNDKYSSKGYICLQEKEYIEQMINKLKDTIKKFSENVQQ